MKFNIGDLVLIKSVFGSIYNPPALIVDSYVSYPKIFPFNESENKKWIISERIKKDWVYDIIHMGQIEIAVSGEWLVPWDPLLLKND